MSTAAEAVISPCGRYRYTLERELDPALPLAVLFVMLNPSTADATKPDPTITRCMGFARRWGYGRLLVGNLYAYRDKDPRALRTAADPVGPHNDDHLAAMAERATAVVCAWGATGGAQRKLVVRSRLSNGGARTLYHLGLTLAGQPRHPLYVAGNTPLTGWQ